MDAYLKKLRSVLRYCGVSDCRMDRGQMRADVNLSLRRRGEEAFGTRTEMKNLNSFQFISLSLIHISAVRLKRAPQKQRRGQR